MHKLNLPICQRKGLPYWTPAMIKQEVRLWDALGHKACISENTMCLGIQGEKPQFQYWYKYRLQNDREESMES